MIPARVLTQTITRVRAGVASDRYGNEVADWQGASRHDERAWIEQLSASENIDQRDGESADWLVILASDSDLAGRDRVEFDGKTFDVVGPPTPRNTLRGLHHIEATLRWVEG